MSSYPFINRVFQIFIIFPSGYNSLETPEINPIFSQEMVRRNVKNRLIKEVGKINSIDKNNIPKNSVESPGGFEHIPVVERVDIHEEKVVEFVGGLFGLLDPGVPLHVEVLETVIPQDYP